MTEDAALEVALTHYRITLAGSTWSAIQSAWTTEYNAVAKGALSIVLFTAGSFEGGNASAQRNFEQTIRLRALQLRRAEVDPDFAKLVAAPTKPTVTYPIFGPLCFPH